MTPRTRVALGILLLSTCAIQNPRAASPPDPDKDPQMPSLLEEARILIKGKKLSDAIEKCDKVIASFKAHYESRKEKIYCARTSSESLGYLLKAAADKGNAIALSATWADAYFIKAYALQDLGRIADAKSTVKLAVELSPMSSHYLSELGNIYQLEKNWSKAEENFAVAEDNAPLSPDDVKAEELGRARRGLAYVFVEQGKLAEAEKKYKQCLADDPKDTKAARELEYVRGLRAKKSR
jgi:tetratricopeptide (TPR) repeat protein